MSQAYKCDRCGNLFDMKDTNAPYIIYRTTNDKFYNRKINLCVDCTLDLIAFMFGYTVYGVTGDTNAMDSMNIIDEVIDFTIKPKMVEKSPFSVKPNNTIDTIINSIVENIPDVRTESKKVFDSYNHPVDGAAISHKKPQGVKNLLKRCLDIHGGDVTYNDLFRMTVEQCVECRGLGIHAYFQILNHIDKIDAMKHMKDKRHARNFQRYLEKGENTTWKVLMKGV